MEHLISAPVIVMAFILLDIVTGVVQAAANNDLRSDKMRQGLYHKSAFIGLVVLAYLVEYSVGYVDLGFNVPIALPVCAYICGMEILSISENLKKLNPELDGSKALAIFKKEK